MADQQVQDTNAGMDPAELRTMFREVASEVIEPIKNSVSGLETQLEEKFTEVRNQVDELDVKVQQGTEIRISEREPEWSPEDKVLERSFFAENTAKQIRNGDLVVSRAFDQALITPNGDLVREQADTFITHTLDQSQFLQLLNVERMNAQEKEMDKLDVASRIIRKKTSRQKPVDVDPTLGDPVVLSTVEYGFSTQIAFEALEDNIMRGRATNYILDRFSTALANDMADLGCNGTGNPADGGFLEVDKGYIQLLTDDAGTNNVAAAGFAGDVKGALFPGMRDALPVKYRRLMPAYIVSVKIHDAYLDQLSNRATDLGDTVLTNGMRVPLWQNRPVIPADFLPDGVAILTPLRNLLFGIQRNVTFGVDVYNVPRYADYGWTVRTDFGLMHAPTAVLVTDFVVS